MSENLVDLKMSGSETGVMTSRDPFSVTGLQHKTEVPSQPVIQNMRLAFSADGAAVYKPITTATTTTAASPTWKDRLLGPRYLLTGLM